MKKIAIWTILLSAVAIIVLFTITNVVSEWLPSQKIAQNFYDSDCASLEIVVQYLSKSDTDWLITEEKPYGETIDNNHAVKALDQLFDDGYLEIGKQGDTIYFLRWTRWNDFGAGLAYTIHKEQNPKVDYIVNFEPLSQDQWYYYETN